MAITRIGGAQIDLARSAVTGANTTVLRASDDAGNGLQLTGSVLLKAAPLVDNEAATKKYVDDNSGIPNLPIGQIVFSNGADAGITANANFLFASASRDITFNAFISPDDAAEQGTVATGSFSVKAPVLNLTGSEIVLYSSGSARNSGISRMELRTDKAMILNLGDSTSGTPGGAIQLQVTGTEAGSIAMSAGNMILSNSISDRDIIFTVNDGGTATEVFRVDGDVSAVLMASGKELRFADSGEKISGNGTDLTLNSGADINLTATADVNLPSEVGLTFGADTEKIEVDGSNNMTANANGSITLDAAGAVNIDSAAGSVVLKDGGTVVGGFGMELTDLVISSSVSNRDIIFSVNTGGTRQTLLTLDSNGGGGAGSINIADARPIRFNNDNTTISNSGNDLSLLAAGNLNLMATTAVKSVAAGTPIFTASQNKFEFHSPQVGDTDATRVQFDLSGIGKYNQPTFLRNSIAFQSASSPAMSSSIGSVNDGLVVQGTYLRGITGMTTGSALLISGGASGSITGYLIDSVKVYKNGIRLLSGSANDYTVSQPGYIVDSNTGHLAHGRRSGFDNLQLNFNDSILVGDIVIVDVHSFASGATS
jgi:hypothetical protein